jgi:hypothetical protein
MTVPVPPISCINNGAHTKGRAPFGEPGKGRDRRHLAREIAHGGKHFMATKKKAAKKKKKH